MRQVISIGIGALLAAAAAASAQVFFGPSPYLSSADSPLSGPFEYSFLETFEDGAFNTPGATPSAGWTVLSPNALTDSVDADDGAIDGSGSAGRSFFSNFATDTLTVTFDAAALGGLPTHAGLVWTDVGQVSAGAIGFGSVSFSATGPGGVPLGSVGPAALGDGAFAGQTTEDRFFGVTSPGGISSITLTMFNSIDWELDHVQYARIPEPTGAAALLASALVVGRRRGTAIARTPHGSGL